MSEMLTNPDRAALIGRIIKEASTSPASIDRVVPSNYLDSLISREFLGPEDIKVLLDSIEIALGKGDTRLHGLIKDLIENEYRYLWRIKK